MSMRQLNNLSDVYLEAVYGGGKKKESKGLVVTNADKKANTPAYQNLKKGVKGYKAADHLKDEVEYVSEGPSDVSDARTKAQYKGPGAPGLDAHNERIRKHKERRGKKKVNEEVIDEADPRLAIYQSGLTDASRVKGRVGKAVDKVKDKVKKVLGKKDKVSSHLDRYRYQSGLDNYLKSKVKKEEVANEDYYSGTGEKVQKRTKAWMDKKGQKGAPGLDAIRARAAEHKAKRGVKEEVVDEGLGLAMTATAGLNAVGNIAKAYGASQAAKGAIVGGALSGAGALAGGALNYAASRNNNKKKSDVKPQEKKKEVKEGIFSKFGKKKKVEKKPSMDTITTKVHKWRKDREKEERRKYVSDFDPIDEGKGYQPEIEHSKLGDAKKKADKKRESKLPPHLQGDAIGKMKKAFATEEDKAFNFVLDKIRKEEV